MIEKKQKTILRTYWEYEGKEYKTEKSALIALRQKRRKEESDKKQNLAKQLRDSGSLYKDIAKELNVSISRAMQIVYNANLKDKYDKRIND
jgi:hypothetical protein